MEPNTAKMLGGVGSVLTFLYSIISLIYPESTFIWAIYHPKTIYGPPDQMVVITTILWLLWWLLYFIGPILVLLSLRGLGSYYNDEGIKRNSLRWFIWWVVILTAASYAITTPLLLAPNVTISTLFIAAIVLILIDIIFTIISAIYLKRAYAALAAKSGEGLFNTAAKLYWWGSLLLVLLVGVFLVWISWVISAAAFFSMKPQRPSAAAWTAPLSPG